MLLRPRTNDPDSKKGLYPKFAVKRLTKSKKHKGCRFFVLDLDHDQFAKEAMKAYAKACTKDYPLLATDLVRVINDIPESLDKLDRMV
jgi:hypothetical protein